MYPFNVRVYGVLDMQDSNAVLLSEETVVGNRVTKFPGGGLQFGEGTKDALRREFLEELMLKINVHTHLYTTDFFQPSAFNSKEQIISIYYLISVQMSSSELQYHLDEVNYYQQKERQEFSYLLSKEKLKSTLLDFSIDQYVAENFILSSH